MDRFVGYARVSSAEQSTGTQVEALKAAGCVEVFVDDAVSGARTSRPQLDACLASLTAGDTLVVTRLDRLGRSTQDLLAKIKDLSDRKIGFRSLKENVDVSTSVGRLLVTMLAAIAEFERDLIIDRTNTSLQSKKNRGETLGRPVKLNRSQIQEARRMLEDGKSPSYVARIFRVDRSTLYRAMAKQRADSFAAMAAMHGSDPALPAAESRYLADHEVVTKVSQPH